MMPVFIYGEDLDGNVAGLRILLEVIQNRPAKHIGQKYVERDRGRAKLAGEGEGLGSAHRHQHLEVLLAGEIAEHASVVDVVFDDKKDTVFWFQIRSIVLEPLDGLIRNG